MKTKRPDLIGNQHAAKTFKRDAHLHCRFNAQLLDQIAARAEQQSERLGRKVSTADIVEKAVTQYLFD